MTSTRALVWFAGLTLWGGCPGPSGMDAGAGGGAAAGGAAGGTVIGGGASGGAPAGGGTALDGGADAGVPLIEVAEQLVDFATVDCGSTPAEKPVTLRNAGTAPLPWVASLEGPQAASFSLSGPSSGTIAPGSSAQVRLRFVHRPGSVGLRQGLLRIESADPSRTPTVSLRAETRGPFFNTIDRVDFGSWPPGTPITTSVPLFNTGTVTATVTISGLGGEFVTADGGSSLAITLPAGTTSPLLVPLTFRAQRPGRVELSAQVSSSVPSCGEPFGPLSLGGEGTTGAVTGLADLDFGDTGCGEQAAPRPVRVTNSGSASFQVLTATLSRGAASPYSLTGFTPGVTVTPGATVEFTVTPRALPAQVELPGDFSDVLELTTSVPGDQPHLVRLTQSARGAVFVWDSPAVNLESSVGRLVGDVVSLRNIGNVDVDLDATVGAPFELRQGSSGPARTFTVNLLSTQEGRFSSAVTLSNPRGPLCAPLPPPLRVEGRTSALGLRVLDQRVTLQHACGQPATGSAGTLRVSNDDAGPVTVTARFVTSPGPFVVERDGMPAEGLPHSLRPGEVLWLTTRLRTPVTVPAEDLLLLTTDRPGDGARVVPVSVLPRGAAVRVASPGVVVAGTPASLVVSNDGSVEALVRLSVAPASFAVDPTVTVPPGQQRTVQLRYRGAGMTQGTVTATVDDLSCLRPASVTVTGVALSSSLVLSRTNLDFGLVPCGAGPSTSQTVTLTNVGAAAANWAVNGAPQKFELRPLNGTLGPGQSVELSVTHRGFVEGDSVFVQRDEVRIGTPGDEVPLVLTAQSARALPVEVGLPPAARATVPGTGSSRLRYVNTGTVPGTLRVTTSTAELSGGSVTLLPGEARSLPLLFAPADAGTSLATVTVTPERTCGAPVPPVSVRLEAFEQPVLTSSHPAFDFGRVACGSGSSTSTTVVLRNPGPAPVAFTATLTSDAGVGLVPGSGSIPPRGSLTLQVTLPSLGGAPTITPLPPTDVLVSTALQTLVLPVDVSGRGADLRASVAAGAGDTRLVGLSNHGNVGATVAVSVAPLDGGTVQATVSPALVTLEPLTTSSVSVSRSSGSGALEVRLTPVAGQGEVCSAASVIVLF